MSRISNSVEWKVPLSAVTFGEDEVRALVDSMRSGWWTYGPVTRQLESEFADFLGVSDAFAVANGTAALELAFHALGLKEGDEVLTPALTFVAASNCILHTGALPRFVDVESAETPLVTEEALRRAWTPRTRGICVMHYAGYPCPMDSILAFAREKNLWIVEDAAHAPGASWRGVPCGGWGDVACFSFFGNKNLTCGEGGMIVTRRRDVAEKIRLLRSHGMTSLTWDRHQGHQSGYDVLEPGYNYRMDDLRASVLRVQLASLERMNQARQEKVRWYRDRLSEDRRWQIPFTRHGGTSAYHLFPIVLEEGISRETVMDSLKSEGIQTSVHYPPVHQFSYYRKLRLETADLKVTESLGRRLLTLPLYPELSEASVDRVCRKLRLAVAQQKTGDRMQNTEDRIQKTEGLH